MKTATCPNCHAEVRSAEANRVGSVECPFCQSVLADVAFRDATTAYSTTIDEPRRESPFRATTSVADGGASSNPPVGSRITIVEQTPDHLILVIEAAGWRAKSIIFLAVVWNAVSWIVAGTIVGSEGFDQADATLPIFFLMILLFIAIGVAFAMWAIHLAFARTLILLEHDRVVVQTILFGYKRRKSIDLVATSCARLEVSHEENDRPVYRVAITGPNGKATFGTALSNQDKDWVVAKINNWVSPDAPQAATMLATDLDQPIRAVLDTSRLVDSLDPVSLPSDTAVRIDEQRSDELCISLPIMPAGKVRRMLRRAFVAALVVFGLASAVWIAILADFRDPLGVAVLLFPLVLFGGILLIAVAAGTYGRITTKVNSEGVTVRWHLGPFGKSRFLARDTIDRVAVGEGGGTDSMTRHVAIVASGDTIVPLTTFHDRKTDVEVAGLVRWQLERLGQFLADE